MAVIDALIQSIKHIPLLLSVSDETGALSRKTPMEIVYDIWAQQRGVSEHETLAVIFDCLFRRRSGQERRAGVEQILQRSSPENRVLAIGGKVIVDASDKRVVVELCGSTETEA